jgi:hypothetical protein
MHDEGIETEYNAGASKVGDAARPTPTTGLASPCGCPPMADSTPTRAAVTKNMAGSSKKVLPKKRGRPATGREPVLAIRLPRDLVSRIDAWAAERAMTRSAAIRRWIEKGLLER